MCGLASLWRGLVSKSFLQVTAEPPGVSNVGDAAKKGVPKAQPTHSGMWPEEEKDFQSAVWVLDVCPWCPLRNSEISRGT